MPEPIVRSGLKSAQPPTPQGGAAQLFPPIEGRIPGTNDEDLVFESFALRYRLQLNSPEVAVNLVTGTKTHAKNEVICFDGSMGDTFGIFVPKGPNAKRDVEALMSSKSYGVPFKGYFWLRSERQKMEVSKAVEALTVQLRSRPDLISQVSRKLKELAGATKTFTVPAALDGEGDLKTGPPESPEASL